MTEAEFTHGLPTGHTKYIDMIYLAIKELFLIV